MGQFLRNVKNWRRQSLQKGEIVTRDTIQWGTGRLPSPRPPPAVSQFFNRPSPSIPSREGSRTAADIRVGDEAAAAQFVGED